MSEPNIDYPKTLDDWKARCDFHAQHIIRLDNQAEKADADLSRVTAELQQSERVKIALQAELNATFGKVRRLKAELEAATSTEWRDYYAMYRDVVSERDAAVEVLRQCQKGYCCADDCQCRICDFLATLNDQQQEPEEIVCPLCKGDRVYMDMQNCFDGIKPCERCKGSGKVPK